MLVHMESLRNIGLHYRGLYCLQIACGFEDSCLMFAKIDRLRDRSPSCLGTENSVSSSVFLLQHQSEIVKLNETGVFRGEVALAAGSSLELKVQLLFASTHDNALRTDLSELGEESNFRTVCTVKLELSNPMLGVNQFVPVIFTDAFSSVLSCSVHCMPVGYKFSLNSQPATDLFAFSRVWFPQPGTVLSVEEIETLYHSYVMLLALAHNKVRKLLLRVLRKAGVKKRRGLLPASIQLPLSRSLFVSEVAMHQTHLLRTPFTSCFVSRGKAAVTQIVYEELSEVASRMCEIRHLLSTMIREYPCSFLQVTEFDYHSLMKAKWDENVFTENVRSINSPTDSSVLGKHCRAASSRRNSKFFLCAENLAIRDPEIFLPPDLSPILFEEKYDRRLERWSPEWFSSKNHPDFRPSIHLFVCVHGLLGSRYDMKRISDTLALLRPEAEILISKANENLTEGCIEEMGRRLASEVTTYIAALNSKRLEKISFIGHSLGGLIIRASLPLLAQHKALMHLFFSLNSPHLGCNGNSKLVDAGLWLIRKFNKSLCLDQLAMTDSDSIHSTLLYKLAKQEQLGWFKHVILLNNSQDNYVTCESARIQCSKQECASKGFVCEMADLLQSSLSPNKLTRVEVNYKSKEKRLGKLIGKTGHVRVLDDRALLMMLIYRQAEAFV